MPDFPAMTDQIHFRGDKMKMIALRTLMTFGMALLGGIALITIFAAGLNVLTWLD
jgi:hypothetical protein